MLSEKERQFSIDLSKKLELLAKDQALNEQNGSDQASKSPKPKPSRARDRTRPVRPRPPPIRRQIFKCEHIGCSYQSDRNFNFLRHKRTHCKNKAEDEARPKSQPATCSVTSTAAVVQPSTTTTAVLADISGVKPTQTLVIINSNNSSTTHPTHQTLKLFTNHNPIVNNTIANITNIATNTSSISNVSDPLMSDASPQTLTTTATASNTIETNANTIVNIASVVSPEELQAIKTSIDSLLNNCDTTDHNVTQVNAASCDDLSSYHQKVVFV